MLEEQAKARLRQFIAEAKARKESRLPSERQLAQMLKLSRITISKALAQLVGEGLLRRRQGSGTFIVETEKAAAEMGVGIGFRQIYWTGDGHLAKIMQGASRFTGQNPVDIQIYDKINEQFEKPDDANRVLRDIKSGSIRGFIIATRMPLEIVGRLYKLVPLVVLNNIMGAGEVTCVSCDYFLAGFLATEFLIKKGHGRIGYVTNDFDHPETAGTLSGYKAALKAGGQECRPEWILETKANKEVRRRRIEAFFAGQAMTAVYVRSDRLASDLMRILMEMGKKVPEDVSIIGTGNVSVGINPPVPLTTVDNRTADIARLGMELLEKKMRGITLERNIYILDPFVVEKESVGTR